MVWSAWLSMLRELVGHSIGMLLQMMFQYLPQLFLDTFMDMGTTILAEVGGLDYGQISLVEDYVAAANYWFPVDVAVMLFESFFVIWIAVATLRWVWKFIPLMSW